MSRTYDQADPRSSETPQQRTLTTEMALAELRQAFELSQEDMASVMQLKQPAVSKIETNKDMFVSTLRRYIEAMGGELNITARFDDQVIRISQFESPDSRY